MLSLTKLVFLFKTNSLLDAAILNNHDTLFLGYYYARPLCARTKGKQAVIQDGDVKTCKRFPLRLFFETLFEKLGTLMIFLRINGNGTLRFIMQMRIFPRPHIDELLISHDYVPVFV